MLVAVKVLILWSSIDEVGLKGLVGLSGCIGFWIVMVMCLEVF